MPRNSSLTKSSELSQTLPIKCSPSSGTSVSRIVMRSMALVSSYRTAQSIIAQSRKPKMALPNNNLEEMKPKPA